MACEPWLDGPLIKTMGEWSTPILHADVDAFYASVEVLRDPTLRGKPVIVGGTSSRGVVTSASYEARQFGITSAMPTSRARRLCPQGIFIQPDFEAYTERSHQVREVFETFSPVVESLSLDEAFLDLNGASRMWDDPHTLASALRRRVQRATGLVVSVGLASNKFLAKLASTKAKPDGMIVVERKDVYSFLSPLPVSDLWGVGAETAAALRRLGLITIGDVAQIPPATLVTALGPVGGQISRLARGIDERKVTADPQRRSLGAEETFERDLVEPTEILRALLALSDRVAARLRAKGSSGHTVTVKIRFANFKTITRSKTLDGETDGAIEIYRVASALVPKEVKSGRTRVRLLGVSLSNLEEWPAAEQLRFESGTRWKGAERAVDRVRRRFGDTSMGYGALLQHP